MNLLKYFIFVFKNRKEIQKQNWNIWAYERNLEDHVKEIESLLKIKIWDIRKFNYLTHEDCFNYETIEIKKSDLIRCIDSIKSISCYMEKPCWENYFIHNIRKLIYK